MPIGVSSCYNEYVNGMFPNETEAKAIENRVLSELKKLIVNNTIKRNDMFGIGGSYKTIKKVLVYLEYIGNDSTIFRFPCWMNYSMKSLHQQERIMKVY